jgi:hypothetical protein
MRTWGGSSFIYHFSYSSVLKIQLQVLSDRSPLLLLTSSVAVQFGWQGLLDTTGYGTITCREPYEFPQAFKYHDTST